MNTPSWADLGIRRPSTNSPPGSLFASSASCYVRGYDTYDSPQVPGFADDRFSLWNSRLRADETLPPLARGDLVFYAGGVDGTEEPQLWAPALVVSVGESVRRWRSVLTLTDDWVDPPYVPYRTCEPPVRQLIEDLAMSGRLVAPGERRALMHLFGF